MIPIIRSIIVLISINIQRVIDHAYRYLTGTPTISRSKITPNIFLGGQYRERGLKKLKKYEVTAIVNMRTTPVPEYAKKIFHTLHLPTVDRQAPSIADLRKGIEFIDTEIKNKGKVYIHCHWGEGRGPSMVIAYLMHTGLTFEDAYKHVRSIRRFVNLTKVQEEQLNKLEAIDKQK